MFKYITPSMSKIRRLRDITGKISSTAVRYVHQPVIHRSLPARGLIYVRPQIPVSITQTQTHTDTHSVPFKTQLQLQQYLNFDDFNITRYTSSFLLVVFKRCGATHLSTLSDPVHFSRRNTFCFQNFVTSGFILISFGISLTGYVLLNTFTKSSKRFRSEETFHDEHTFCTCIHYVFTYTTFTQLARSAA
jgi:hypothetical protein